MSSSFEIREHVVEAQHIREYPRATAHSQEEVLYLAVKQYIPKNNPNPQPGDVTIIGAHANGFPKELYEPMWEDLLKLSATHGFRIRSIWIADVACQGQSGIINESKLGNDPSWIDHSRDLLHMINHFRTEMPRPLVGVGHSFGATTLTHLGLLHPRLLSAVVLMDPVMNFSSRGPSFGMDPMTLSAKRRDLWPSHQEAVDSFKKSKFYQSWDPRVLDAWIKYGIRTTPTLLYPDEKDAGKATLTTSKHMEVFTYLRPLYQAVDENGKRKMDSSKLPDITYSNIWKFGSGKFYRPESPNTAMQLPQLRPSCLYIFGGTSAMSTPSLRKEKLELTGTGVGGSGGEKEGRVKEAVLEDVGHLVAMDRPKECAEFAASWIGAEVKRWHAEEEELQSWWKKSLREKQLIDDEWMGWVNEERKSKL